MATKLLTELEQAERGVLADPTDAKAIEHLRGGAAAV
jgi:hypothetical protein